MSLSPGMAHGMQLLHCHVTLSSSLGCSAIIKHCPKKVAKGSTLQCKVIICPAAPLAELVLPGGAMLTSWHVGKSAFICSLTARGPLAVPACVLNSPPKVDVRGCECDRETWGGCLQPFLSVSSWYLRPFSMHLPPCWTLSSSVPSEVRCLCPPFPAASHGSQSGHTQRPKHRHHSPLTEESHG